MLPTWGSAGRGRGRGRGSNTTPAAFNARGRGSSTAMPRGPSNPGATFGTSARGNARGASRGGFSTPRANSFAKPSGRGARGASSITTQSQGSWQQRFDKVRPASDL